MNQDTPSTGPKAAHMCRDGHTIIYHNDSEHEQCPLCRAIAQLEEAISKRDEWKRLYNFQGAHNEFMERKLEAKLDEARKDMHAIAISLPPQQLCKDCELSPNDMCVNDPKVFCDVQKDTVRRVKDMAQQLTELDEARKELATLAERFNCSPENAVTVALTFATTSDGVLNRLRSELTETKAERDEAVASEAATRVKIIEIARERNSKDQRIAELERDRDHWKNLAEKRERKLGASGHYSTCMSHNDKERSSVTVLCPVCLTIERNNIRLESAAKDQLIAELTEACNKLLRCASKMHQEQKSEIENLTKQIEALRK